MMATVTKKRYLDNAISLWQIRCQYRIFVRRAVVNAPRLLAAQACQLAVMVVCATVPITFLKLASLAFAQLAKVVVIVKKVTKF